MIAIVKVVGEVIARLALQMAPGSDADLGNDTPLGAREEFDAAFYADQNADVHASGVDLFAHYTEHGWTEGRKPNRWFDPTLYLEANPDVASAGLEPLEHYVRFGRDEGRPLAPSEPDATPDATTALIAADFNGDFYLQANPDVAAAGLDPLAHYVEHGWRERRNPTAWFSTSFYLGTNPDVLASGQEPFAHFLMAGAAEGRLPRPLLAEWRCVACGNTASA